MTEMTLPKTAGQKRYYPLPEIYSSSLTTVSYLSTDPKFGGTYKDLFSPAVVSATEVNGVTGLVSKFLQKNYSEEKVVISKTSSLEDKLNFLENEGYFVAPIYLNISEDEKSHYSSTPHNSESKEVGGIITSRNNYHEQAEMYAKELNGEPFVFNILYQNTKSTKNDLSKPLYPVVSKEEVIEALDQLSLKESKDLVKQDWQNLALMSMECRKNCWIDAVAQNPKAFSLAPDDIRGNNYSIISAVKKSHSPAIILSCAKEGDGLVKACNMLLQTKVINYSELPSNLQAQKVFDRFKPKDNIEPWNAKEHRVKTQTKTIEKEKDASLSR